MNNQINIRIPPLQSVKWDSQKIYILEIFINFLGNILHGTIFGTVSSSQQILHNSSGTAVAMKGTIVISCNITSHLATHKKALKLPLYIIPTQ
jgi:hypothetical protein